MIEIRPAHAGDDEAEGGGRVASGTGLAAAEPEWGSLLRG